MTLPWIYCTDLVGGTAGCLDAVSIDDITNKEMALVVTTTTGYIHVFDSASTDPENSPQIIEPDDADGPGRWILQDLNVIGAADFSYANFQHQEAQGIGGGSRTTGVWTSRPYNTTVDNEIADCSLAGGNINLPPGKYDFRLVDVQWAGYGMRIKLYNETDSTDILEGMSIYASPGGGVYRNVEFIFQGRFTIADTKTISVKAITSYTHINGLGVPSNITGEKEVYGILELWRIGES